jgi:hypothetical protein
METKGYGNIPDTLFEAIIFLAQAQPKRSVPTWLELLFGAMLTQAGFVTEARHAAMYQGICLCAVL